MKTISRPMAVIVDACARPVSRHRAHLAMAAVLGALCASAHAQPSFDITTLGLTGSEYVSSDGYSASYGNWLNDAGQVAGGSRRYGGTTFLGADAWFYDGSSTLQLGFTGTGYEQTNGTRISVVRSLNAVGQVTGSSDRFSGTTNLGQDAWLYNGSNTLQLGFTGTGYEQTNGYRESYANYLSAAGKVAGYSRRYSGATYLGQDAWLYNGSNTLQLGFTGTGYEQTNGTRVSQAHSLNAAGQAAGRSTRYIGTKYLGQDAWLYDGTSTLQLGFTGTGYEQPNGTRASYVASLNAAGQVAGYSDRYSGTTFLGADAWFYDGSSTLQLGFTGTGYEQTNGTRISVVQSLNAVGQAAGHSTRYSGTKYLGQDAWLYDGTSTLQLGFTGTGYEQLDGYRESYANYLNTAGQVAGHSTRYSSATTLGQDAWLANGSSTLQIGLTDSEYHARSSDGYRYSQAQTLNAAGQVAGYSTRYSGTTELGRDAWLYDVTTDDTYSFTLSTRPSDDYAYSYLEYLDNSGFALGRFTLFDQTSSANLGDRAFYFSLTEGMVYVLDLLVDDLGSEGWSYLAGAVKGNALGQIIGLGKLASGGQGVFLLTPSPVPLPAAAWLFGTALVGLVFSRRFKLCMANQVGTLTM